MKVYPLSLRAALNRIESFEPATREEIDRIVAAIHAELDKIAAERGDVVEGVSAPSGRVDIG